MRRAARAIVIKDNNLLVMHRNKFGTEYDTLPGGNVNMGESPDNTVVREVAEETGITVQNPRLVFIDHAGDMYGDQFVFLCEYQSGEPQLTPGTDEDLINKMGKNLYIPKWVELNTLGKLPFLSEELKQSILHALKNGWPEQVFEFQSKRTV